MPAANLRNSATIAKGLFGRLLPPLSICIIGFATQSRPSRGAWIEIDSNYTQYRKGVVAPLAGRVD